MSAQTFDVNIDVVGRRHRRTNARGKRPDRHARRVVHAVDLLDLETVHQAVLDHRFGARAALFGRLKDHHGIAAKFRVSAR